MSKVSDSSQLTSTDNAMPARVVGDYTSVALLIPPLSLCKYRQEV